MLVPQWGDLLIFFAAQFKRLSHVKNSLPFLSIISAFVEMHVCERAGSESRAFAPNTKLHFYLFMCLVSSVRWWDPQVQEPSLLSEPST